MCGQQFVKHNDVHLCMDRQQENQMTKSELQVRHVGVTLDRPRLLTNPRCSCIKSTLEEEVCPLWPQRCSEGVM